jgi:hypothetical protein
MSAIGFIFFYFECVLSINRNIRNDRKILKAKQRSHISGFYFYSNNKSDSGILDGGVDGEGVAR